jgi:hypothetical protein
MIVSEANFTYAYARMIERASFASCTYGHVKRPVCRDDDAYVRVYG